MSNVAPATKLLLDQYDDLMLEIEHLQNEPIVQLIKEKVDQAEKIKDKIKDKIKAWEQIEWSKRFTFKVWVSKYVYDLDKFKTIVWEEVFNTYATNPRTEWDFNKKRFEADLKDWVLPPECFGIKKGQWQRITVSAKKSTDFTM